MQTDQSYKVNEAYKGQRNILVPTKMYSRNALLNAMHIKSDKYLGVNLDRYALTFHSDKEATNKNPDHEIAFSHIKSLEADVTKADSGKYYLKVHTDEGDLKFKFNNARDFHSVVEALRNTIHNDKPFYNASESYTTESKKYQDKPSAYRHDKDEISSDDQHDYVNVDRNKNASNINKDIAKASYDVKKQGIESNYKAFDDVKKREDDFQKDKYDINKDLNKDIRKDNLDAQRDTYKANRDLINENRYDAGLDKDANRDMYKYNKDAIKDTYDAQRDQISQDYKLNKDYDKDLAKDQYKVQKEAVKDERDVNLADNKNSYDANKAVHRHEKLYTKKSVEMSQDRNELAYQYETKLFGSHPNKYHGDRIKSNINFIREGTYEQQQIAKDRIEKDIADTHISDKTSLGSDSKVNMGADKDIKTGRH